MSAFDGLPPLREVLLLAPIGLLLGDLGDARLGLALHARELLDLLADLLAARGFAEARHGEPAHYVIERAFVE